MSCLVNPYGWRLYFRQYWPNMFYANQKIYSFTTLSSHALTAYLDHVFSLIHLSSNRKTLLDYLGFKCVFFNREVFVLVKYRLYWSLIFKSLTIGHNKMLRVSKGFSKPYRRKNKFKKGDNFRRRSSLITRASSKNITTRAHDFNKKKPINRRLYILNRFTKATLLPNYTKLFARRYYFLMKNLFCYFYFVPVFEFYKKLITLILQRNFFKASVIARVFFFGVSWRHTNARALLNFVQKMLFKRNFSAVKTLYSTLRVLKKWQKKLKLKGFKFLLAGRFTRRDRATFLWKTFGSVQMGTRFSMVEFASVPIQLKYSRCIAKLWLCHG